MNAQEMIAAFKLVPLAQEGGHYREVYRGEESFLVKRPGGEVKRSVCTSIYYLLASGEKSYFHKIHSDELWHFYLGGPLLVVELKEGKAVETILGQDFLAGQKLQHVVKAGTWFAALPAPGTAFSLVGCTVSPGFDFADFELGERGELVKLYPGAKTMIEKLTPESH